MNFFQSKSMAIDLPRLSIGGLVLSFTVLVLQTGCMTVQDAVTGESTYNLFSMEEDVALGQEVQEQNLESFRELGVPVNEDQEQVARLNRIMDRLKPVVDLPDLPWEVNLIQTNIVNAAAAPGGKIIVFSGLYDPENGMVHNDDELAAVMAHEMAHVTCRHVTESITRQQGIETSAQLISAVLGQAAGSTAATAFSYLYSGTAMFLFPHYSRVHENEADRVGLFYMAKAGYDPRAAVEIWRRASESAGGSGSGLGGFLSSHPQNQDRMLALEANMPEALQYYEGATGNTGTESSTIRPRVEGIVPATPLGNGDPTRVRKIAEDGASEGNPTGRRNTIFRARPVPPSGPDQGKGR